MEAIHREGGTRRLGVSNVGLEQLRLLCESAAVRPAYVQNRSFARLGWDREVRAYCREAGIVYQGFSLLTANPEVFRDARFVEIVQRVGCTPAQAVFRFATQIGMLPLTGTTDPRHMREDLDSMAFDLSPTDLAILEKLCG